MRRTLFDRKSLTKTDLAALIAFLLLAASLIFCAFYSDPIPDESYYYTIPQRLAQGDRLFIEIWQMSQLCGVFQIVPYFLFTALTRSTEGIVLFMRLMYVGIDLIFFVYFYLKLRERKLVAILAAFLFCSDHLFGMLCVNYYNSALQAIAAVGMILFFSKKEPSPPKLILAGILLAAAVLNDPGLAMIYAAFTLLVLLRETGRRRGRARFESWSFAVNGRTWLWMTVGVAVSAAAFLLWLQAASGIGEILANMSGISSDSEYQLTLFGNALWFRKLENAAAVFSIPNLALLVAAAGAAVYYRIKRPGLAAKKRILLLSLAVFVSCHAVALVRLAVSEMNDPNHYFQFIKYSSVGAVPLLVLAFCLRMLSENRDRRMTAFLILTGAACFGIDYFSNIVLSFAGRLAWFPAVFWLAEILKELRAEEKAAKTAAEEAPSAADGGTAEAPAFAEGQPEPAIAEGQPEAAAADGRAEASGPDGAVHPRRRRIGFRVPLTACLIAAGICVFGFLTVQRNLTFVSLPHDYNEYFQRLYDDKKNDPSYAADKAIAPTDKDGNAVIYYKNRDMMQSDRFGTSTEKIKRGPYRGLRGTAQAVKAYNGVLTDLDRIEDISHAPLFVAANMPYAYLYSDLPAGAYSSLYVEGDNPERILQYWDAFPEKRSACIYIPYEDGFSVTEYKLDDYLAVFACEVAYKNSGYILTIAGRK
ncbi:MAG: hypothetical protein IJL26_00305 [Clostridia bacterium]|nr:hypothetical protein [Clostridia bacterium]